MIGVTIAQITIFIGYLAFIVNRYGVLGSISESWYKLEKDKKMPADLFNLFTVGIGGLMLMYNNMKESTQLAFVVAGLGLMMVGIASMYKDKTVDRLHYAGATVAILLGFTGLILEYGDWIPLIVFVSLAVILKLIKLRNYTWWIEIIAFLAIMIRLLIN